MFDFPLSPGITKNQDLKDRVLQDVYHRKIKDLKSMPLANILQCD